LKVYKKAYITEFSARFSTTSKLSCRKDERAMRPIYGYPEKFGVPQYTHGYFP